MLSESQIYLSHAELLSWVTDLDIIINNLISTYKNELWVLQLLYLYRYLNSINLNSLFSTNLIVHCVWLTLSTLSYSAKDQIWWLPHKKWWLRKIVQNDMMSRIYKRMQHINNKLSAWNTQAVIVNKTENSKSTDELQITFNYSNVKENMSENYIKLFSKIYDYLSDSQHKIFFQVNIKHEYFSVILHSENRHVFVFIILSIEQLQSMRMSQDSRIADHTMSELMNITLKLISESLSESSLLYNNSDDSSQLAFYMNDIFSEHIDFESQFSFLKNHFLLWIEWVRLTLLFKKLQLFVNHITAFEVDHYIERKIFIREAWIVNIIQWLISKNVIRVQSFLRDVEIIKRWVKNFAEIVYSLSQLTEDHSWQWTESELLFFKILWIKYVIRVAVHSINWSLIIYLYTDTSEYADNLVITQYQLIDDNFRSVEVSIIYDFFTFSVAERKYHIYKQKLCAMIKFAFKYYYLLQNLNQETIIYTDHKSLVHFLKLSLHDEIYSHWAAKLRELYIKIMHIKEKRNTVTDNLFCIIFHWENCLADDTVQSIQNHLNCESSKWVWKNNKNSFNTFLKDLSELKKIEVIENESLHSLSVFVLENSVFWDTDYLCSEWFNQIYQYLYTDNLSDDLSVPFLRKCLNYCLNKEIWLWVTRRELNLLCVSETKVAAVLQKTHNYSDHWEKKNIILKLRELVYWLSQSTDVKKYIQRCLSYVWHYSAQWSQLLHSIVTHCLFQLMIMNFIRSLQRSISADQKYILHIMNYFSCYSVTYLSQTADASDVIKTLNNLFHHFSKSDVFYIDRDQHFENQLMKDYFKE